MDELSGDPSALRAEARRLRHTADLVTSVAAGAVQQVGILDFEGPAADRLSASASGWRLRAGRAGDELLSVAFMLERAAAQIEEQQSSQLIVDFGSSGLSSYLGSTPAEPVTYINLTSPISNPTSGGSTNYVNLPSPTSNTGSTDSTDFITLFGPDPTPTYGGGTEMITLFGPSPTPTYGSGSGTITLDLANFNTPTSGNTTDMITLFGPSPTPTYGSGSGTITLDLANFGVPTTGNSSDSITLFDPSPIPSYGSGDGTIMIDIPDYRSMTGGSGDSITVGMSDLLAESWANRSNWTLSQGGSMSTGDVSNLLTHFDLLNILNLPHL